MASNLWHGTLSFNAYQGLAVVLWLRRRALGSLDISFFPLVDVASFCISDFVLKTFKGDFVCVCGGGVSHQLYSEHK